jgi:hypothetical protein
VLGKRFLLQSSDDLATIDETLRASTGNVTAARVQTKSGEARPARGTQPAVRIP